jgi:hypothetical protein
MRKILVPCGQAQISVPKYAIKFRAREFIGTSNKLLIFDKFSRMISMDDCTICGCHPTCHRWLFAHVRRHHDHQPRTEHREKQQSFADFFLLSLRPPWNPHVDVEPESDFVLSSSSNPSSLETAADDIPLK